MTAYPEVCKPSGIESFPPETARMTIGRSATTGVALLHDEGVPGLHAVLKPVGAGWWVRDVGSRHGIFMKGERILGMRTLRHGDEVAVGRTPSVVRAADVPDITRTEEAAPALTRRERNVLRTLRPPPVGRQVFAELASLHEVAAFGATEAAVQQHLIRPCNKFRIAPASGRCRSRPAKEAVPRGAVIPTDPRDSSP